MVDERQIYTITRKFFPIKYSICIINFSVISYKFFIFFNLLWRCMKFMNENNVFSFQNQFQNFSLPIPCILLGYCNCGEVNLATAPLWQEHYHWHVRCVTHCVLLPPQTQAVPVITNTSALVFPPLCLTLILHSLLCASQVIQASR